MAAEIERKFLVADASVVRGLAGTPIRQGYLSTDPERTVRIRTAGSRAFVTIKGKSSPDGRSRDEYEYEIPLADANELLDRHALRPIVSKIRYRLETGPFHWDVDVFDGANEGLVIAEIELDAADREIELPDWLGAEVTGDPRYYNASLVAHPYRDWRP